MEENKGPSEREKAFSYIYGSLANNIAAIPADILNMTETELELKFNPTPVDFFLRKRFWDKVQEAETKGLSSIDTRELFLGVCSKAHYYNRIVPSPHRLAWICLPMHNANSLIEEAAVAFLKKVRDEFFKLPVNEKTAGPILKALEFFANRAWGPVIQKIEQKSMNVNVSAERLVDPNTNPEDLMQKYAEMKAKIVSLPKEALTLNEPKED